MFNLLFTVIIIIVIIIFYYYSLGDIKLNFSGAQLLGQTLKHCSKLEKLM